MGKTAKRCIVIAALILFFCLSFFLTPAGRAAFNLYFGFVQKVDDNTNYYTKKEVEDKCRAMVASYTADVLIYEQYKCESTNEKQAWAEQARMRANTTAAIYNQYILKNSYVWEGNIPDDIEREIPYF